jgi:hypothetical protein
VRMVVGFFAKQAPRTTMLVARVGQRAQAGIIRRITSAGGYPFRRLPTLAFNRGQTIGIKKLLLPFLKQITLRSVAKKAVEYTLLYGGFTGAEYAIEAIGKAANGEPLKADNITPSDIKLTAEEMADLIMSKVFQRFAKEKIEAEKLVIQNEQEREAEEKKAETILEEARIANETIRKAMEEVKQQAQWREDLERRQKELEEERKIVAMEKARLEYSREYDPEEEKKKAEIRRQERERKRQEAWKNEQDRKRKVKELEEQKRIKDEEDRKEQERLKEKMRVS